jgi:excisionase family DNA binding protein
MSSDASKVTSGHLSRGAYLYVRQSTMYQVIHNTESSRRQYDLKGRAIALGWQPAQVHVIDIDQGSSGASAADRAGFQQLVAEVSMGRAGIVLGLECSRLARDNADWQQLIKICALNGTLICDEDGLYDPADPNDRLLLGMKGQISEFELHYLQARMRGSLLAKASRGELALPLPAGLAYDAAGNVTLDPDAGIRAAVARLFAVFEQTGSASAVVKAFSREHPLFPSREHPQADLQWKPLTHDRALRILHNPRYAGAYCYGRRDYRKSGGKRHVTARPREEWTTLIPGAHDGYITWAQFEANQQQLAANAAARGGDRSAGPPREGAALLQGLVICGKCGRKMTVGYHGRSDGTAVPDYACQREGISTGTPRCQHMCGSGIDAAVAALVLDELTPLAIEAAFQVTGELRDQAAQADALRATHVQRARHTADAARRRYLAVDPANRLVADSLEADWNNRLRDLRDAEEDYQRARQQAGAHLTEAQISQARALASDLPALWRNPATTMTDRKRLIRLLVTDVTLLKDGDTITAHVRLSGGQDRTLAIPRPLTAWEAHTTPEATLTMIRELAGEHPFDTIAAILNGRGVTSGRGRPFTTQSLAGLCHDRGIPSYGERLRAAGYLTAGEAAAELGVAAQTISRWRRAGLLDGRRVDGRGTCLFPPGQQRPATRAARAARDCAAAGQLSARQLGAQLGVTAGTITRWHHLGLISASGADRRGHPLYPAGQQRPTWAQITAAGRDDQDLITGGQLAARLGVARSTIYKWHRRGLINAPATDGSGRRLYRSTQQAPSPGQTAAARAATKST